MALVIRAMLKKDVKRVGSLLFHSFNLGATKHGYAPKFASRDAATIWAWSLFRYTYNVVCVAEIAGEVAGITSMAPRGAITGIGPVVVAPEYQGQNIASQLMQAVVTSPHSKGTLRLFQEAYNTASFSLFYSYGFFPITTLLNMQRPAFPTGLSETSAINLTEVSEATKLDVQSVYIYDRQVNSFDRSPDLAFAFRWGKIFVLKSPSNLLGFLATIPGRDSVQLGPLVAESGDVAARLFHKATIVYNNKPCHTRIMAKNRDVASVLYELGFKLYCIDNLMVRGTWEPKKQIEAFGIFPEGI